MQSPSYQFKVQLIIHPFQFKMKRFYTLMLGLLLAVMLPAVARAFSVTIGVDNPANLVAKLSVNGVDSILTLQAGDNAVNYSDYATLSLNTTPGVMLKVYNVKDGYTAGEYLSSYNLSLSPYADGAQYNVTTMLETEVRTASFTLDIDNPEKVAVTRGGTYTNVAGLQPGENTVLFIPGKEDVLMVRSATYGTPLYSVTLNGVEQTESWGSYNIPVTNGANVKVISAFPDGPAALALSYVNGDNGCISRITLNGNEVELTDNVSGRLGDKVEVFFNETDYVINSVAINGGTPETSNWGFYSRAVTMKQAESTMVIDATKHATFNVTLKLTAPEHVNVYRGSEWNYDTFNGLTAGENTLSFSTSNTLMTIVAKNGNLLKSVLANGEVVPVQNNKAAVTVTEGMVVEVESGAPSRDNTMVVYVDNLDAAEYGYSFMRADRSSIEATSGYNTVKFDNADMPMLFAFYVNELSPAAYVNDQPLAPMYDGGATFQLPRAENNATVVKFYLNGTPAPCNVSFQLSEGIQASATRDLILPVTLDPEAPVQVLAGTRFDLTVDPVEGLEVLVDNAPVAAVDNVYTFTANADTQVSVNVNNALENITLTPADGALYNLQGIRITTATPPAGLYIQNGKLIRK